MFFAPLVRRTKGAEHQRRFAAAPCRRVGGERMLYPAIRPLKAGWSILFLRRVYMEDIMKQNDLKEFSRYTFLSVMGMLGLSCYILADTYFIAGKMGADGLTALNLAIPVYNLIHGSGLMLSMGGGALYSIAQSRNDAQKGNTIFIHVLLFWGILSVLFMGTGLFGSEEIARLLGAKGGILPMTEIYLRMILLFSPCFLMNNILLGFLRNDNAPKIAMAGMLTGSFANILLDYLFMYPLGWGMFGAVFATCLSPVISMAVMAVFFLKCRNHFRPIRLHPDGKLAGKLLLTGFPSLVNELSSGIVMIVFNFLMLRFGGNTAVAAYGVIANISLVVIAMFTGIAQGAQPLISRYHGCGEITRQNRIIRLSCITSAVLAAGVYLFLLLFADWTAGVFNSQGNAQLQEMAVQGLRWYFAGALPAGLNIVLCMAFTCTEHPQAGNLVSMLRGFILIVPMAFLLGGMWQIMGLWLAFPMTEIVTCGCALWLMMKNNRVV